MKTYHQQYDRGVINHARTHQQRNFLPFLLFVAMIGALLLLDAVIPLRELQFDDALLTHIARWTLGPANILFPNRPVTAFVLVVPPASPPTVASSWKRTALLFAILLNIFLLFFLALRLLPRRINHRFIFFSTLILGLLCVLIPVISSSDVYSYIAYARIAVFYHLNPLTTLPSTIHLDPVYRRLRWIQQPSAYGPTWIIITYLLQWFANTVGLVGILAMLIILRLFGLAMHLGSCWLIWSITGHLQQRYRFVTQEKRLLALLAFAWNPLLLFEACVNAHNDATLLFFVLLAIYFLVRREPIASRDYLLATAMLALATCLKLYVVLLFPGFLLFLWTKPNRVHKIVVALATYLGIMILLYAPFWQNGAILNVLLVNPADSRNINSPAEFVSYLFNGIFYATAKASGFTLTPIYIGSLSEHVTHVLTLASFVIIYGLLCWRTFRAPYRISTVPGLIRWLATAWLLYCFIGAPWFWPWYAVTFFGLYALIEVMRDQKQLYEQTPSTSTFGNASQAPSAEPTLSLTAQRNFLDMPLAVLLLTFSLLTLYCFFGWGPTDSTIPGLPGLQWAYLRGLWLWALPLLAILLHRKLGEGTFWKDITRGKDMRTLLLREASTVARQFAVFFTSIWPIRKPA